MVETTFTPPKKEASDIPNETHSFLEEPSKPERKNYSTEEVYQDALTLYQQKLEKYEARIQFLKDENWIKEVKGITYPKYDYFCPVINERTWEREPFRPAKVAIWLALHDHFKTDETTDILYFGNGTTGKWTKEGDTELKKIVTKIMGEYDKENHYRNILHSLKGLTYSKINFSRKIAVENGTIDLESQEFHRFSLDEMVFYSIPITYDPEAKCPNWEQFVSQILMPDDIATLQEWSGFCLLPDYRFHKIMWMVGTGRNGKGVWQRTIETILGDQNVGNVGLEEFDGTRRFSMAKLYGKLVNFCSEPKTSKELQTNLLKYATGQDTIEAEIKCKQKTLRFKNYAKITVLANKFPKINDQTTAFRERRLFLKFPFEFTGANQIQNIEDNWLKINDERSGILNWMLAGLKRLLEQGYFTTSRTQEQAELEFLRASDSITAFINECASFGKNFVTTRSEAKTAYEAYCDYYGLEMENDKKFTAKLKDTPKIKDGKPRIKGVQERAWIGVTFKVLTEETEESGSEPQKTLDFETDETLETGKTNSLIITEEKLKECKTAVSSVSSVSKVEVPGYNGALTCVFCQKPIIDDNWTRDDFTWDKPAHKKCYDEKREQVANQDSREAGL